MDKLVTADEIAERLDVADRSIIHNWRLRGRGFPEPVVSKGRNVMLWYWPEVETWAKANGRWPVKEDQ